MEQKPKLLEQVRAVARARHLSHRTEDVYHNFIKRFILFHNKHHLKEIGAEKFRFFSDVFDSYFIFTKIFKSSASSLSEIVRKSIKTLSSKIRVMTGGRESLKDRSNSFTSIFLCFRASKIVLG